MFLGVKSRFLNKQEYDVYKVCGEEESGVCFEINSCVEDRRYVKSVWERGGYQEDSGRKWGGEGGGSEIVEESGNFEKEGCVWLEYILVQ